MNGSSPMSGNRTESLAELWSGFLEREALEGSTKTRRDSVSTPNGGTVGRNSKVKESPIKEDEGGDG